jgi:hypothetical protein
MIRDPSDGSVREKPSAVGIPIAKQDTSKLRAPPDTGLRQPTRTDAQERLERSREWLRKYQQAGCDANSMNDKGEVTNDEERSSSEVPKGS